MTFEEKMQEYAKIYVEEHAEEIEERVTQRITERVTEEVTAKTAKAMKAEGIDKGIISKITGLSVEVQESL